jgi:hypothetical protein
MRQIPKVLGASLALFALCAVPSQVLAKDKVEKASSAAKKAVKKFFKLKNYTVNCEVQGGVSDNKKHTITQGVVSKSYEANSYKKIMQVTNPQAFRRGKGGAILDAKANRFKALEASADGKEMSRLFRTPEDVFAEISKNSSKAKWIQEPVGASSGKKKANDRPTTGQDGPGLETESQAVKNGILRVVLSSTVSLKRFIEVQNSGCLGGG